VELDIEELNDHSYHRKKSTWQLLKSFLKLWNLLDQSCSYVFVLS